MFSIRIKMSAHGLTMRLIMNNESFMILMVGLLPFWVIMMVLLIWGCDQTFTWGTMKEFLWTVRRRILNKLAVIR